ncbi:MAG: SCO family protein [Verrucomicrobiaceae bacterium]|nr:SCO family protein [Verrucomicrobiaceae bacterium]
MSRETKIVYGLGAMAVLIIVAYLVLWKISSAHLVVNKGKNDPRIDRDVDRDLELIDANSETRRFSDLKGKVWLVSHVFTRCPGQCSGVCAALDELIGKVDGGEALHLVSVSLDPVHDRPSQLSEFAQKHDLVRDNWWFVTGNAGELNSYMKEVFWLSAQERPESQRDNVNDLFIHDPRVVLVDHRMRIHGWYYPFDPTSAGALERALEETLLAAKKSS